MVDRREAGRQMNIRRRAEEIAYWIMFLLSGSGRHDIRRCEFPQNNLVEVFSGLAPGGKAEY